MEPTIAGIDVHKRVLMVVVLARTTSEIMDRRKFGTTVAELNHLAAWLSQHRVEEVAMESTAQYWRPVWNELDRHFQLHLAQAWSNRAPRGRKTDFADAERLGRRFLAGELTMSLVPGAEQREWRETTRRRTQLTRDRARILNQVESLLEPARIKLSSVITDLFGATGLRILQALVEGETDPERLADLADERVKVKRAALTAALAGRMSEVQGFLLRQHLEHLTLLDRQLAELAQVTAQIMRRQYQALQRLTAVPGIRIIAAQQIVAETGAAAEAFATPGNFSSWIGVSPGKQESAEKNLSAKCPKGNPYLRRILCQVTQAAVRTKNCIFQKKFQRLLPRLGYVKALWAVARHMSVVIWKILHDNAGYIEYGGQTSRLAAKRRLQRLRKEALALGFVLAPNPTTTGLSGATQA